MSIVEVAVPALRRATISFAGGRRVPEVDVFQLGPKSKVRVRNVEQTRIDSQTKPCVVEPELHAVCVLADDEFLAGATAEGRVSALAFPSKTGFGVCTKTCRVG